MKEKFCLNKYSQTDSARALVGAMRKHSASLAVGLTAAMISGLISLHISGFILDDGFYDAAASMICLFQVHPTITKLCISALVFTCIYFFKMLGKSSTIINEALIAQGAGLFYYSPNDSSDGAEKSKALMREKSLTSKILYIQCSTGWMTFAHDDSPLVDAVRRGPRDIRIIMAHPESGPVRARARTLTKYQSEKDYHDEILTTLQALCELKKNRDSGVSLEVKLYTHSPCWKDIVLDDFAWTYHYVEGINVDDTPCYGYCATKEKLNTTSDMYSALYCGFLKEWNDPGLVTFTWDVSAIPAPRRLSVPGGQSLVPRRLPCRKTSRRRACRLRQGDERGARAHAHAVSPLRVWSARHVRGARAGE